MFDFFLEEKHANSRADSKGIFLQKAKHWEYEKEWRICFMNDTYAKGTKYIKKSFKCVSAIYLGPRISKENEASVIQSVKQYENKYNSTIKIYKMYLDEVTYEIKEKEIIY